MPSLLRISSLSTYHNPLGLPEGSLLTANNIVIDRNNTARPRRGFSDYGDVTVSDLQIKTLINYKDRILRHVGDTIQFDSDAQTGLFSTFSGNFTEIETGIRIKSVESSGNLYFTTNDGVKKISGTISNDVTNFTTQDKFIKDAGGPSALDVSGTLVYEDGAFLTPLSKTAYRVVWGSKDANNNIILGSPSSRTVVTNTDSNKNTFEVSTVDTSGIAGSALDAKYFLLSDGDGVDFFVWYNLDAGSTQPSTSETVGRTGIEVAVLTADTDAIVASKTATALINSTVNADITISTTSVTISNRSGGDVTNVADGAAVTGFAFSVATDGSSSTGKSASVDISFSIPFDADTTDFFYQIYRTGISSTTVEANLSDVEPGDEMNLVYEANLTSADISAGTISINDATPDSFRVSGTLLYSNPVSGEGILQANEKPPRAADIEIFQGSTFYANTQTRQSLQFSMLGAGTFVSGQSSFVIGNSSLEKTYTFVGSTESFALTAFAAATITDKSYFLVNSASNERKYFFWIDKSADATEPSDTDTVGRIAIRVSVGATDTDVQVAAALTTAISDQTDFTVSAVSSTILQVINVKNGASDNAVDGITGTGFSFGSFVEGSGETANTVLGGNVLLSSLASAAQSIDETARSLVRMINSDIDTKEATNFTCVAPASLADGESFLLSDANDANKIQFYYDTTGGNLTIPTPVAGYTLERIDVSADVTSNDTATTTGAVIGAIAGGLSFNVVVSTATVFVENVSTGVATDAADVDTGYTFTITQPGTVGSQVSAFYISGVGDLPGTILLRAKNLSDSEFYLGVQDSITDITTQFSPTMSNANVITNIAVDTATTATITSAAHGYSNGDEVYVFNNDIRGKRTVSGVTTNTFIVDTAFVADTTGSVMLASQTSSNDVAPNRVYFSKNGKPEAVPSTNYIDVGGKDNQIERIIALRDNLFVLKSDGVYILTGIVAPNFGVRLLDNSVAIVAPDSAARLNNQIYMLSTQGVATVSDGGVGVVSRKIEDRIFDVTGTTFNTRTAAFGVGYETDRSYLLWVPTISADTVATQVYRFNTFNQSWVRWTGLDATSAVVNSADDKIYLSSGNSAYIRKERKNGDRTDYADSEGLLSIQEHPFNATDTQLELNSTGEVAVGDVLVQTQYVSIATFNRTLRKLDLDALLTDTDYNSTLALTVGADLQASLIALVAKVDADDTTQTYTVPTGTTFLDLRDSYNVFIGELNASTGVSYNSYETVTLSTEFEAVILEINSTSSVVTVEYTMPMLKGEVSYLKGILSEIEWAPQHFGDPSILKQIAEGTVIFDGNNFVSAELAFSSDASKDISSKKFFGRGPGFWGGWVWGDNAWGGSGTDAPYRTLIPREKQRCRYITVKFIHRNAREIFSVLGISLNVRPFSTRAYRGL